MVLQDEELEPDVRVERELAVVGDHLAAHAPGDLALELVRHGLLKGQAHVRTLSLWPFWTSVCSTFVIVSSSTHTTMRSSRM